MARTYKLGKTDVAVTPIGLGCWQFSRNKGLAGSYWPSIPQDTVNEIVRVSLEHGVNWFDTAEVYGKGASEQSLAHALHTVGLERDRYVIADKWFPAFRFAGSIEKTFPKREQALEGISIDLHQVHQPMSFSSVEAQMAGMAHLVQHSKIRAVGVSNFNQGLMVRAHRRLETDGLALASNQMRFSLLDREIERNGVLEAARELGISIIAYSPLAQGLLTGKFHTAESIRSRKGPRKWLRRFKPEGIEVTRPLIGELESAAEAHDSTAAQVALAWVTQRHDQLIVAIPGASRPDQAISNAQAMGIRLTNKELETLSEAGLEAEKKLKKL